MFAYTGGLKGDTGEQGIQGDAGIQGIQGDAGIQGIQGEQGIQGIQGVAGSANFTDRGDLASIDWEIGDLTIDGAWHDLDLSGIVGANAALVCIRLLLDTSAAGKKGLFRTNGNSNSINVGQGYTAVLSKSFPQDMWVVTDAAGKIEYNFTADLAGIVRLSVAHWFVL